MGNTTPRIELSDNSRPGSRFKRVNDIRYRGAKLLRIPMDEADFIETVRREASLESTDEAREVTTATLQTFGERITDGEASDITVHFPDTLAAVLMDVPSEAEAFSLDEFIERVSDRADIDKSDVIVNSQAVIRAISLAAADELDVAREQLPSEFDVIFEPSGPITQDEFLETVRERAGLDSEEAARSATGATLRSLSERLSAGEAADLALYLPESLGEDLVHADDESATGYSFDEFAQRVSQREGVEKADAKVHARAVGSALADTAGEREVEAARKQLPDPFGVVFESPTAENR